MAGGVSLPMGFGGVVDDGLKKLNFGGCAGFNGLESVAFGMPEADGVVDVLESVKSRGAAAGGKSGDSQTAFVGVLEKGLLFAELVYLVIVFWISKGLVDGWRIVDCGKKLNFGTASTFFISSLLPGFASVPDGSSSESPLMNNDSSLVLEGGECSALEISSTIPSDWACSAPTPSMTAGSVLPRRLCSTSLFENTCFRREFESVKFVRIVYIASEYEF